MYTQFFGNFILNKGAITPEQLIDAISYQKATHIKLGTLAIHAGYMTASEVESIHIMQTHVNKLFGQLAIEQGYLTCEQVEELLTSQKPDYLLFGQILIDRKYITHAEFEKLLNEYQFEFEINNLDFANDTHEKISSLITSFYNFPGTEEEKERCVSYLNLFFFNLLRFIGEDFTPLRAASFPEYPTNFCVSQEITGPFSASTALDMNHATAIAFASRYADESFEEFDEYVSASIEDFLNLHNGLFTVNMSNEFSIELGLAPPKAKQERILSYPSMFFVPIIFPFGTMNLIFTIKNLK